MDAGAAGVGLAADDPFKGSPFAAVSDWSNGISRRYQHVLDRTTPHVLYRWLACLGVALVYVIRVYLVEGFYVVSYGLGIYILNLLIGFLSPQVDPEIHDLSSDGPSLPTRGSEIVHMIKYKYVPFSFGKQRYNGKKASSSSTETAGLLPRD
ncbi:protein RER1A-like [Prunus avium]|uniref:Protein RER1A-like n=1 Tax=Prunus avium TaxID=42229 RepID=A0A6P5RVR4_PRUAV|nr:protein RER1A-like [Prunus avium]